jgi:hypothetical protein
MRSLTPVALFVLLAHVGLSSAGAQQTTPSDVIRGRVTNDSSKRVVGAMVFVTRGPDRAFKQTTTDSTGQYSITFENGTGDYLVAVTSVGLKSARRRVQRQNSERELVADFVLAHDLTTLAAVKVTSARPERASNATRPSNLETGSAERWSDGVNGQLSPSQLGNLAAIAGNLPGVTQGPGGISILGSGSESNLTTLNGMALPGGSLPRAAKVDTRVTGATFDPIRGGFSGANVDVRLGAGNRNYQERDAYLTFDTPALQATDAVGRALGAQYGSFRGSVGANGELIRQTLTYNAAVDVSRSTSDAITLLSANTLALGSAGVSRDSLLRVQSAAGAAGLPVTFGGVPTLRERNSVTLLGRLDDIRDSLNQRQLTAFASLARQGAIGFAPLNAPSSGADGVDRSIGVQLQLSSFVGPGRRVLNQTKAALSETRSETSPYLNAPGASVLLRSTGEAGVGIASVALGGNSIFARDESRWTGELSNLTVWNARGRRHTFKAFAWARGDRLTQTGGADVLGRYSFNSLEDFTANRPQSFSRTLVQPDRAGATWNAAGAFAHSYSPTRTLSFLYGVRAEANGFAGAPGRNPALEQAIGFQTGVAPTRVHLSPRAGFSYRYSRSKDNGNGVSMSDTRTLYRYAQGVVQGGVGEFRDLLRPDLLADAAARTGLAASTQSLLCTGAAVPLPDWSRLVQETSNVPSRCLDGGGVLTDNAPPATLIDPTFDVPRSWRANLDWFTSIGWMQIRWASLASLDRNQASVRDANFAGVTRFVLSQEGGRPVYVSTSGIDAVTAAVSPVESRRSTAFGRVGVRGSELRGIGAQSTLTLAPDPFRLRKVPFGLYGSVSYTIQQSRREYLGFDGLTAGDPQAREWAPSATDARHIVIVQASTRLPKLGTLTAFARAQSGLPFTPQVQGDINGDGRSGDRAFVPSRTAPLDATLATQLLAIEQTGSVTARRCLSAYSGEIAARNGCRGPWTATLNAQFVPRLPSRLSRLQARVFIENVLAGVDQALHGTAGLRGWGGQATPDPVLLVPRSFDVPARAFRYDINPRFAETRPQRTTLRNPFRVTLDFSFRLSTDFELQRLRTALEPVRVNREWRPRTADSLTALYLRETSNVHASILAESDSLLLTPAQIAALQKADTVYSDRVRQVYGELGQYLSQYAGGAASKAALDSANATKKAYWRVFWEQPEIAGEILTPTQRELMSLLKSMMSVSAKDRAGSQYYFGNNVKFAKAKAPGAAPATTVP